MMNPRPATSCRCRTMESQRVRTAVEPFVGLVDGPVKDVGYSVGGFELGLIPVSVPSSNGAHASWRVPDVKAEFACILSVALPLFGRCIWQCLFIDCPL